MDVEFADEMERQINTLNEQQLSALWRWVTVKYMSVCEQRLTMRAADGLTAAQKSEVEGIVRKLITGKA